MKRRKPAIVLLSTLAFSQGCATEEYTRREAERSPTLAKTERVASVPSPYLSKTDRNVSTASADIEIRTPRRTGEVEGVALGLAGPLPVMAYLNRAMAENRNVQSAKANVEAFKARIPQVTSLEDPIVSNTIWPFPSNGPQYSLMGYMPYETMVTQQFPWLGTLKLRGQAAEAEVRMAVAELIAAELDVVANVKRAYYDLYLSQRTLKIIETNRSLAGDFIELAGTRYQTGSTSQQDVLRAEVALAELDRERIVTQRSLGEARAELAQQLHISPESELQTLDELPMLEVPAQIDDLYRLATSSSPEVQNKLAAIVRDERQVELARKKFYPNISVGLSYSLMTKQNNPSPLADGRDNVGMFVGFNLPIYRKKLDAGVSEAQARVRADVLQLEATRDKAAREVKDLILQSRSQRDISELLTDRILPRSRQALEIAAIDYRSGKLDYLSLMTAWREVLQIELQIAQVQAELGKALASLERTIGAEITAQRVLATPESVSTTPPP